jgi:hypothetical protein
VSEEYQRGISKVDRYGWSMEDKPGEMRMLDKHLLRIDPAYQRNANDIKIREMAGNWSWIGCGVITVAERPIGQHRSTYFVVDGQHRVLAAMKRADISDLPCIVFRVLRVAEEAGAFLRTNTLRKPITAIERFNAMITSGDQQAIKVKSIIDATGLDLRKTCNAPKQIKCLRTLLVLLGVMGEEDFRLLMETCSAISTTEHVKDCVVQGLAYIHRYTERGLRDERLLKRIHDVGDAALSAGAVKSAAYFSRGHAKTWAVGMIEVINHRLHNKFELATQAMRYERGW